MNDKNEKKPARKQDVQPVKGRGIMALMSQETNSDVLGSYTGTPKYDEEPVQDADDL